MIFMSVGDCTPIEIKVSGNLAFNNAEALLNFRIIQEFQNDLLGG